MSLSAKYVKECFLENVDKMGRKEHMVGILRLPHFARASLMAELAPYLVCSHICGTILFMQTIPHKSQK